MFRLIPLFVVLGVLVVICFAALVGVYLFTFYSPRGKQNDEMNVAHTEQMDPLRETIEKMIARQLSIPYERVTVTSFDGLKLAGRLYAQHEGAPFVIGFHGYRGTPSRDFSGGTVVNLEAGINCLMIEERSHCSSGGHTITFGVKERRDCLTWIEFIRTRFGPDTPVVLSGISMGAATVLMASGLDLPPNVRGIVADAPFTSPRAIIRKVCGDLKLPVGLVYPFTAAAARLFGGFGLTDADASEAVKRTKVPILLIHGDDDRFVPCSMGRRIAAANPEMIDLETFPGAGHGLSFLVDRPRYERLVKEFYGRVLPK